jgi:hypothetical protein
MGDKAGNQNQRDIRNWMSSPGNSTNGTPARRRRVMTTSDSEEEKNQSTQGSQHLPRLQQANAIHDGNQQHDSHADAGGNAPEERNVIQLDSSSDDSMYVPLPSQMETGGAARQTERNNRNLSTGAQRKKPAGSKQSKGQKKSKKSKPNFRAEAEETSTTDNSSDCDESDQDAQCLYRQAMNGVRNAGNARQNLRGATMNCPVCAKFAAYLQHFLPN